MEQILISLKHQYVDVFSSPFSNIFEEYFFVKQLFLVVQVLFCLSIILYLRTYGHNSIFDKNFHKCFKNRPRFRFRPPCAVLMSCTYVTPRSYKQQRQAASLELLGVASSSFAQQIRIAITGGAATVYHARFQKTLVQKLQIDFIF